MKPRKARRANNLIPVLILLLATPAAARVFGEEKNDPEGPAHRLQLEFMRVAEEVGPAVVSIITTDVRRTTFEEDVMREYLGVHPRSMLRRGYGSGVIIEPKGHILTNYHVVAQAREVRVRLPDGRTFKAEVTGSDAESDLAMLYIGAGNFPHAPLGDSSELAIGQWVVASGNPFGLVADNPQPAITVGVVSALNRRVTAEQAGREQGYTGMIQTDAAINPGNSGGPLINLDGKVIGINTAIYTSTGGFMGVGFAIPINRAKAMLEDLKKGNDIKRGWVGTWVKRVDWDAYQTYSPPDRRGALVARIEPASPAARAGLKKDDIIRTFNHQPIIDHQDLSDAVRFTRVGTEVEVTVWREGEKRVLKIKVGEIPPGRGRVQIRDRT